MRRGVTMIETLVSICLFLVVVILVFNLYPGSLLGLRRGEQRTQANRLAQGLLEEARARPFEDIAEAVYATGDYQCRMQVTSAEGGHLKRLQVTVKWPEGQVEHELWVSDVR